MKSGKSVLLLILFFTLYTNCRDRKLGNFDQEAPDSKEASFNLISDFEPLAPNGDLNAIIEIPSGTLEKWEIEKESGALYLQQLNGQDRIISYLGYPGNYGMIPRTLLPKSAGGDGDPLDILVLGPPVARGIALECKLLGVLYLEDGGEQDDKLIAVSKDSPLYHINDLVELQRNFNGITEIVELWFTNYKGPDILLSKGYGNKNKAQEILSKAILEYQKSREEP